MIQSADTDAPRAPSAPSINPSEVAKFSAMAADWWDPKGKFRPLHRFNPIRLGFIRDTIERQFDLALDAKRPFEGLRILDIGCGGGLVSEPMARLGASVTGVDASEENIKTAMTHAQEGGLEIDFRAGSVEALLEAGEPAFDVVLNLEVVEHVANPQQFLTDCARLVRPGGLTIIATINRTPKAFALTIIGAEYILRWLPPGTHDFDKFLKPSEIEQMLADTGLVSEPAQGVSYNPLSDSWRLSGDDKVNYLLVATRPTDAS